MERVARGFSQTETEPQGSRPVGASAGGRAGGVPERRKYRAHRVRRHAWDSCAPQRARLLGDAVVRASAAQNLQAVQRARQAPSDGLLESTWEHTATITMNAMVEGVEGVPKRVDARAVPGLSVQVEFLWGPPGRKFKFDT